MPPSMPHVAGVEHREVVVRGLRLHVALAGPPTARPVVLAARLAAALVRVAPPDRAARRGGLPRHRARLPRLRLVGVPARRGLPQGDPGRRPDRPLRRARPRAHLAGRPRLGLLGGLAALPAPAGPGRPGRAAVGAPAVPTRPHRPAALGRVGRLAYQLPIAAPLPNAAKLRLLPAAWATCSAGARPDEVEVYVATLLQPSQVRASTLLYRQFLTRELGPLIARRYAGQRLTVPVLFLVGSEDLLFYEELVDEPAPHADADYRGEVLRGVGHFIPEEAPDLLRDRVLGFLGAPDLKERSSRLDNRGVTDPNERAFRGTRDRAAVAGRRDLAARSGTWCRARTWPTGSSGSSAARSASRWASRCLSRRGRACARARLYAAAGVSPCSSSPVVIAVNGGRRTRSLPSLYPVPRDRPLRLLPAQRRRLRYVCLPGGGECSVPRHADALRLGSARGVRFVAKYFLDRCRSTWPWGSDRRAGQAPAGGLAQRGSREARRCPVDPLTGLAQPACAHRRAAIEVASAPLRYLVASRRRPRQLQAAPTRSTGHVGGDRVLCRACARVLRSGHAPRRPRGAAGRRRVRGARAGRRPEEAAAPSSRSASSRRRRGRHPAGPRPAQAHRERRLRAGRADDGDVDSLLEPPTAGCAAAKRGGQATARTEPGQAPASTSPLKNSMSAG